MKLTDLLPKKPTPPIFDPSRQKILLIAPPKFGKSTWCSTFPKPLFLTTEEGHDSLNVYRISIDRWDWTKDEAPEEDKRFVTDARGVRHMSFIDALLILRETPDFGTLVIDTLDRLYLLCSDFVCKKKGIEHPSEENYGKAWNAIRDEFIRATMTLTSLNRGVIFISHVKYKEIENTRVGSKITQASATISDACRSIIEPEVNIILHGGWSTTKEGERRRVWKCEPEESLRECGDRTGKLPPSFRCKKVGGYELFASFFKQ